MSDVADVLNGLIETCKDGQEGFQKVAEKAKEGSLKSLFSKYSSERASYAQQLQSAVSALGEKPAESGHVSAGLHRGWISIKEALSKDEDKALIDEAEAGEDAAKKAYADAIAKALPTDVAGLVRKQYDGVLAAHNVIRDLKHSRQ